MTVLPLIVTPTVAETPISREGCRRDPDPQRAVAEYRQWIADGGLRSGRVDPIEAGDVASECEHERLPGDPCPSPDGAWPHPHPCTCWGEDRARTPDLLAALAERPTPRLIPDTTRTT